MEILFYLSLTAFSVCSVVIPLLIIANYLYQDSTDQMLDNLQGFNINYLKHLSKWIIVWAIAAIHLLTY